MAGSYSPILLWRGELFSFPFFLSPRFPLNSHFAIVFLWFRLVRLLSPKRKQGAAAPSFRRRRRLPANGVRRWRAANGVRRGRGGPTATSEVGSISRDWSVRLGSACQLSRRRSELRSLGLPFLFWNPRIVVQSIVALPQYFFPLFGESVGERRGSKQLEVTIWSFWEYGLVCCRSILHAEFWSCNFTAVLFDNNENFPEFVLASCFLWKKFSFASDLAYIILYLKEIDVLRNEKTPCTGIPNFRWLRS